MTKYFNLNNIFENDLIIDISIKVIGVIIIIFIWPKLIRLIQKVLHKLTKNGNVDELLIGFIESITKVIMYIIMFYLIVGFLGFQATSLITILGTASLAVGLALQGSLTNLAGGVLILFFKPFTKGDSILFNGIEGEVLNIQMIYTRIRTWDNQVVIIPNGQLANSPVTNFSVNRERRLTLYFSASYDNDTDKVITLLNEVAQEEAKVLKHKPFRIRLFKHNSSSLDYIFRVWVNREDYVEATDCLTEAVRKKFLENNIEIPYNKIDIYKK